MRHGGMTTWAIMTLLEHATDCPPPAQELYSFTPYIPKP